jgi:hypothetical protein
MRKGKYRFLSKPIKRLIFKYADSISDQWSLYVYNKYILKYIRKLNKKNGMVIFDESVAYKYEQFNSIPGLLDFEQKLKESLDNEKGLAHAKAREYWIRRGPRLFCVLFLTILITIGLAEIVKTPTVNDRLFTGIVSINMILLSLYMLFQRLPDSIASSMLRIGHDNYKTWKKTLT